MYSNFFFFLDNDKITLKTLNLFVIFMDTFDVIFNYLYIFTFRISNNNYAFDKKIIVSYIWLKLFESFSKRF